MLEEGTLNNLSVQEDIKVSSIYGIIAMIRLGTLHRGITKGIIQILAILFLTILMKSSVGATSTLISINLSAVATEQYSTLWLIDGGANRSITPNVKDFTSNYRTTYLNIRVAKHNIIMKAIGIGDCVLNCLDNHGKQYK